MTWQNPKLKIAPPATMTAARGAAPFVSDAAKTELRASLVQNEKDFRNGLGKPMTAAELKVELRASFKAITGLTVP